MSIRTPQQYVESLKDGRVVYCLGEKVKDVTQHPILRVCIDWMAMDYVLQQDPRYQSLVTEKTEDGEQGSFVFMPQTSAKDLFEAEGNC